MDSKKVIALLNMLRLNTTGRDSELNRLYAAAIGDDDSVIRLNTFRNDFRFYNVRGRSLVERADQLIDHLRAKPDEALQTLQAIRQMNETIGSEVTDARGLLFAPEPFSDHINVLANKDVTSLQDAYKQLASAAAYLLMLYDGMDSVKDLALPIRANLQECISIVNADFLGRLVKLQRPGYSWVIWKRRLGGQALFGGDCFFLNYESRRRLEVLCGPLQKEPIGTHAYLNVAAYKADETDVPYCWGSGNLLSTTPPNALSFLKGDVATCPRVPSPAELAQRVPTPTRCLQVLTDGKPYCISVEDLVSAMNQWIMGHEFYLRKRDKRCLFCGRTVSGRRSVCSSHFTTEF